MTKNEQSSYTKAPGAKLTGSFWHESRLLFEKLQFILRASEWTCLLGPSGVGKSTLLRLFADLDTGGEFSGTISSDDDLPVHYRAAYMAQSDLLVPWLDIRENVLLGARLRKETPDIARADHLISKVGLEQDVFKKPVELSGGMRQRVALARTLMEDKPFVLLDEPFSALDARTRAEMQELAFAMLTGKTVLLVTHDPAEAARMGHKIYTMRSNGVVEHAPPDLPPLREIDDPATVTFQMDLLNILRQERNGHAAQTASGKTA